MKKAGQLAPGLSQILRKTNSAKAPAGDEAEANQTETKQRQGSGFGDVCDFTGWRAGNTAFGGPARDRDQSCQAGAGTGRIPVDGIHHEVGWAVAAGRAGQPQQLLDIGQSGVAHSEGDDVQGVCGSRTRCGGRRGVHKETEPVEMQIAGRMAYRSAVRGGGETTDRESCRKRATEAEGAGKTGADDIESGGQIDRDRHCVAGQGQVQRAKVTGSERGPTVTLIECQGAGRGRRTQIHDRLGPTGADQREQASTSDGGQSCGWPLQP